MRELTELERIEYRLLKFAGCVRTLERLMERRFPARHDGSGKFARSAFLRRRMKRQLAAAALAYADARWERDRAGRSS